MHRKTAHTYEMFHDRFSKPPATEIVRQAAIRANDAVLDGLDAIPPWTRRETWILKRLADSSVDPGVT